MAEESEEEFELPPMEPGADVADQPAETSEPDELSQAIAELGESEAPDLSEHIEQREGTPETDSAPEPEPEAVQVPQDVNPPATAEESKTSPTKPPAPKASAGSNKSKLILLIALLVIGAGVGAGYYLGLLTPGKQRVAAVPVATQPPKHVGPKFKPRKPVVPPEPKVAAPPAKPTPAPAPTKTPEPTEVAAAQPTPQPMPQPEPKTAPVVPKLEAKPEAKPNPAPPKKSLEELAELAKQYRAYRDQAHRVRQGTMQKNGSWAITQSESLQEHAIKPFGGLAIKNYHLMDRANKLYTLIIIHYHRDDELQMKTHWPKVKTHFSDTMKKSAESLRASRGYFGGLEPFKRRAEQLIWGEATKKQLPMVEIYAAPLP